MKFANYVEPSVLIEADDDSLFERMADLIMTLEPEVLSDDQLDDTLSIIEDIDYIGSEDDDLNDVSFKDEDENIDEIKLAKKTSQKSRMKSKRYYQKNRSKIKMKKKKLAKSSVGKMRKRKSAIMAKSGKTASGRKMVKYH